MPGKVTVVNRHFERPGSYIWCGRPSPLGNPVHMQNRTNEERNRVCDLYERHFMSLMSTTNEASLLVRSLIDKVLDGEDIRLGCACKLPKVNVRCHCDTIKNFIDHQVMKERFREIQASDLF